jgi:hypothetical protein
MHHSVGLHSFISTVGTLASHLYNREGALRGNRAHDALPAVWCVPPSRSSERQMSQPMGSSKPLKKQKLMRATDSITRQTKTSTTQLWGGFKQVGYLGVGWP